MKRKGSVSRSRDIWNNNELNNKKTKELVVGQSQRGDPVNKKQRSETPTFSVNTTELYGEADDLHSLRNRLKQAAEDLKTKGWAVIPNVLSEERCDEILASFWESLERSSRVEQLKSRFPDKELLTRDRTNKPSWDDLAGNKLPPQKHGIWEAYGMNHCDAIRMVRSDENVVKVFAGLIGSSQLWCSMDRFNFKFPGRKYTSSGSWAHVDQHPYRPGLLSVQAYVDLFGTTSQEQPGNQFYQGSHLIFDKCKNNLPEDALPKDGESTNWFQVTKHENILPFVRKELKALGHPKGPVKPMVPKGGMLLWDSRTIHDPSEGTEFDGGRFVVYVCMLGYNHETFTDAQAHKKREAFQEIRSTRHTPCPQTLFNKTGRTYGKDLPRYSEISSPYALWPSEYPKVIITDGGGEGDTSDDDDDDDEEHDDEIDLGLTARILQKPRNLTERCLFGFTPYREYNSDASTNGKGVFSMKYDPDVGGLLHFDTPSKKLSKPSLPNKPKVKRIKKKKKQSSESTDSTTTEEDETGRGRKKITQRSRTSSFKESDDKTPAGKNSISTTKNKPPSMVIEISSEEEVSDEEEIKKKGQRNKRKTIPRQ